MAWVKKKLNIGSSNIIDCIISTQTKPEKVTIMVGTFWTNYLNGIKKVTVTVGTFLTEYPNGIKRLPIWWIPF